MDYNNGKIYVIRNHCNDMVYVGSTTQSLSKRFSKHKSDCKSKTSPLWNTMNELDITNFYIELVEEYPCDNKEQLCAKEGYYIREFDSYNNGYNGKIEGRSQKEYRGDNKEKIKQYYEDNKDKIKQYRENNKEKIIKQRKEYREDNKDKIRKNKNKKINCECGGRYIINNKSRHLKTKKHINYLNSK